MIQVSFYGPHDLLTLVASRDGQPGEGLEAMFGLDPSDEDLRSGSPAAQIHAGMPPYLLVHGTVRARRLWTLLRGGHKLSDCWDPRQADEQVPYEQSVAMRAALGGLGNDVDLITLDGAACASHTTCPAPSLSCMAVMYLY